MIVAYTNELPVMKLAEHSTVIRLYEQRGGQPDDDAWRDPRDAEWLWQFCLAYGADDAGLLHDQRDDFLRTFRQN
jgi:hypothetical protein